MFPNEKTLAQLLAEPFEPVAPDYIYHPASDTGDWEADLLPWETEPAPPDTV